MEEATELWEIEEEFGVDILSRWTCQYLMNPLGAEKTEEGR